jgi:hypothetical protein
LNRHAVAGTYRAPWWLRGGHAQTIFTALTPGAAPAYQRERWQTPDADFIDVDRAGAPNATQALVIFHGLEGHSHSHYARNFSRAAVTRGWQCLIPHFRGCSGEPNRLPRAYHSGDGLEIDWILRRIRAQLPGVRLHVAAVSLGASATLGWLADRGRDCARLVHRVAAISAPLHLAASGRALEQGLNRIYTRMFLNTMKVRAAKKLAQFPGLFDANAMRAVRTLHAFDDIFTAPLHGFLSADDYWARASSGPRLAHIRVPTLVLNARNDPFLPAAVLDTLSRPSDDVQLEFPAEGGHVGFGDGLFPGQQAWLTDRLFSFYSS